MAKHGTNRQFETEIEIEAPLDAVWNAIASDRELTRWFAPSARIEPGVGGEVVWTWDDLHRWPQRIEVWEPGTRLRTRYDSSVPDGSGGQRPLFVDFQLRGESGKTTLRLVHSGFGPEASFDSEYNGISRGWPVELRSLRLYLERHAGTDRQLAWSTANIQVPHDEAWQRLTGRDGLDCDSGIDSLEPGESFLIRTADGDRFEGEALECFSNEFCGVAHSHGDAFLRFVVENCGEVNQVWMWLATYGRPSAEIAAVKTHWDAMLARLFARSGDQTNTAEASA